MHGELGTGVVLPPLLDVQAGDARTCALDASGAVWCWGWDLGTYHGTHVDDAIQPIRIPLPGPASLLGVGLGQECAAVAVPPTAEIWCWGTGYDSAAGYQLGSFAPSAEPVRMWVGRHVHSIHVGYQHVTAHVGWIGGGCGWVEWGRTGERIVNWPSISST